MSPGWSPATEAAIEHALAASATRHYIHIDHLGPVIDAAQTEGAVRPDIASAVSDLQAAVDALRAAIHGDRSDVA